MTYETLLLDIADNVATIALNRPADANAVNLRMAEELCHAATLCDDDPNVRAIVLTGTGKMFSAGGDLASFANSDDDLSLLIKRMVTSLHAAISRFARGDAPVIAAVNGTAAGAGAVIFTTGRPRRSRSSHCSIVASRSPRIGASSPTGAKNAGR